jgi:hypothetical protein
MAEEAAADRQAEANGAIRSGSGLRRADHLPLGRAAAVLLLTALDLDITLVVRGRDIFDALQQLRLKLEPIGWYPLCNGARVDCYPSGMARDMGGAQAVYVLTIGKSGKSPLMGTLDPAARDNVGTVAEQDAYFRRWLDTRRNDSGIAG